MIKGAADFLVTDVVILGILVIARRRDRAWRLCCALFQRVFVPWQGHD